MNPAWGFHFTGLEGIRAVEMENGGLEGPGEPVNKQQSWNRHSGFPSFPRALPMLTKGTRLQHVTLDPVPKGRQDYLVFCQGWGRVTTQ